MPADNATEYFSTIAPRFKRGYESSKSFLDKYRLITDILDRHALDKRFAIDIGCGAGVFTAALSERIPKVVGVDGAERMVDLCRQTVQRPGVDFLHQHLPLPDGDMALHGADLAICLNVLEYITDWRQALHSISSRLSPGAVFIISSPNPQSLTRRVAALLAKIQPWLRYYRYVRNMANVKEVIEYLETHHKLHVVELHTYDDSGLLSRLLRAIGMSPQMTSSSHVVVLRRSGQVTRQSRC